MSLKIRKGDFVTVLSGRDKGARGRVLSVNAKNDTAVVEGVHRVKKHQRPRSQNDPGGIIEREAPIAICKLMLCEEGGQQRAARFATEVDEKGNKIRVLKLRNTDKKVVV